MAQVFPSRIIPVKRRNGKLQSCEPCRKRKLSCDHRLPACGRCTRRGTVGDCYYHPAPLTRPTEDVVLTATPITTHSVSPIEPVVGRLQEPAKPQFSEARTTLTDESRQPGILSVPSAGILMETTAIPSRTGFLGESSSSAVVAELNNSLGIQSMEEPSIPRGSYMSQSQARRAAEVLLFFQDVDKVGQLFTRSHSEKHIHLVFLPISRMWYDGVVSFMGGNRESILAGKLSSILPSICRNTQRPIHSSGDMSVAAWAAQATGDSLRWETLGILIATMGVFASHLPKWDDMFRALGDGYEKSTLMNTTLHLTEICVELSKQFGSRSDLLPCLEYELVCLLGCTRGDTSIECWTAFSEICDTVTLHGLHLEQRLDERTPFFLYELRVQLFNAVFSLDKFLATFLGRPPKISYRYAVVQDPHDLSDEEICLDWPELQVVLSKLEDGWKTSGAPSVATWRKAFVKRHELREDILEAVIGPHTHNLDAQINRIREREHEMLQSMPDFLRVNAEELIINIKRDPLHLIPGRGVPWRPIDVRAVIPIEQNIRHSEFLLQRSIVNKRKTDSKRLITAARRSLSLAIMSLSLTDYFRSLPVENSEALAFFAVPPAGVLAMEVLKRDQLSDVDDTFPQSEILQQLSVLASALEAVDPETGNYSICAMGLKAIRKVLDRLLSKRRCENVCGAGSHLFDNSMFGANVVTDSDFLQWLGSVDFDAASWLDPSPAGYYSESSDALMRTEMI